MKRNKDSYRGFIIGGAIGNYIGELLKVDKLYEIHGFGSSGIASGLTYNNDAISNYGSNMRMDHIGLVYVKEQSFKIAVECATITNNNPTSYLSAGVFAYIISSIIEGIDLKRSIKGALEELKKYKGHENCRNIINEAIYFAESDEEPIRCINELGEGLNGEHEIAIPIYCALKYVDDFRKAVLVSVKNNVSSCSTGTITGNILGAYLGINAIPKEWIKHIQLESKLNNVADELMRVK